MLDQLSHQISAAEFAGDVLLEHHNEVADDGGLILVLDALGTANLDGAARAFRPPAACDVRDSQQKTHIVGGAVGETLRDFGVSCPQRGIVVQAPTASFARQLSKLVGAVLAKPLKRLLWPLAPHPHDDRAILKRRRERSAFGGGGDRRVDGIFDERPADDARYIGTVAAMPCVEDARDRAALADPVLGLVQEKGALVLINGGIES